MDALTIAPDITREELLAMQAKVEEAIATQTVPDGWTVDDVFKLKAKIDSDLGGVAKMKEDFIQAGVTQFGSGWSWIAVKDGKLAITKTANGENPLVHGGTPILGCDVWEHSYYIDYRNRRPDYLKAFMDHLVNWDHVAEMFDAAMSKVSKAA